jgi:CRP/FNR family transcriptional regulator
LEAIVRYLQAHPFFQGLTADQLTQIGHRATLKTAKAGETLSLEGDPCTKVYLVLEGRVQALKASPQGREQVVAELGRGQALYVVAALDGGPLPATTRAHTRVTLLGFSRQDFVALLREHPELALQVLTDLARHVRQLSSLVEDLSLRTVPQRLARLLLERATSPHGHRMTQREMAAQLGTVREVLARALAQLQREGWIRVRRGVIEVVSPESLRAFSSGELPL